MLTEDIIEVKKNKKKYKMGCPETLSYPHKVKDIYEAKKDKEEAPKEPPKKEKKKHVDPHYQRMINYAKAELPYVKDEDDAISRLLQNRAFKDHWSVEIVTHVRTDRHMPWKSTQHVTTDAT